MSASRILLVETDPLAGAAITRVLGALGHTVTTVDEPAVALSHVAEHDLVLIDIGAGQRPGVEVCREIRATPSFAQIPVMCVSSADDVEERIRYLEAGADDVITRPIDDRELEARVVALLLRFHRTKDRAAPILGDGAIAGTVRVLAVYGPKGGVGTTTIAANVALTTALKRPDQVAILDLALPFGGVATHLNLTAEHTLADLVQDENALQEPSILRTYAVRHSSGLHVLAGPTSPEQAEAIEAAHIDPLVTTALGAFEALVVDAGSGLDDRTMSILDRADSILVPLYPEIAALKAVHAMLDFLTTIGSVPAKMTFVLNNTFAREILRPRDIESALGTRVSVELPYDPFVYLKAVNEGIPVVQGAPRSAAAERLSHLAGMAFGENGTGASEGGRQKKRRLGGILRR